LYKVVGFNFKTGVQVIVLTIKTEKQPIQFHRAFLSLRMLDYVIVK
jgi:hypothetical protein